MREKIVLQLVVELLATVTVGVFSWQAMVIGVSRGIAACVWLCVGGTAAFLALLVIHELGHFLAGWAMGFPFQLISVGPFQIRRETAGIRVRFNRSWFKPAFFAMHDLTFTGDQRLRVAIFIAGGPLANLIVGGLCLTAACVWNSGLAGYVSASAEAGWRGVAIAYPRDFVTALLNAAGVISLVIVALSLIPARGLGLLSDGALLLALWRNERPPEQTPRPKSPQA